MTATVDAPSDATLPEADKAFHVEQHGIDYIPINERWARPRDLFGMWAGASVQIEYFVYGAILMTFGFTFAQAVSLIVIGNISFLLLGVCSLQGPDAGTTVFAINRASYGPNGSRLISFFNWITQIGFETEGLILIVGALLVLAIKAGFDPGTPAKVVFILVAVAIQIVLPFLGHATIVKTLRLLIIPFAVLFAVLLGFSVKHAHLNAVAHGANWQTYMSGLAFTIILSGLGWAECGNDFSRYLPPEASKKAIVGWVFLGTAVPEILVMTLGAVVGTFLAVGGHLGQRLPAAAPTRAPSRPGSWWSSCSSPWPSSSPSTASTSTPPGVTLQALGVKVKRYQAVVIDSVICLGVTIYAIFDSSFSTYLKDFVDVVIIWIAPWVAIFLVDWGLRKWRYVPSELQRVDRGSLYWSKGGVHWPAIIAQLVGMAASMSALYPTFTVPSWVNPITVHSGGADFSVFTGVAAGGIVYAALAWKGVRRQAETPGASFWPGPGRAGTT